MTSQLRPLHWAHRGEAWTVDTQRRRGSAAPRAWFLPLGRSADVFGRDPV